MEKAIGSSNEKKQTQVNRRKLVDITDYYHILNKDETKILYTQLSHIYDRIIDMELHTKKLKRKFGRKGLRSTMNSARGEEPQVFKFHDGSPQNLQMFHNKLST